MYGFALFSVLSFVGFLFFLLGLLVGHQGGILSQVMKERNKLEKMIISMMDDFDDDDDGDWSEPPILPEVNNDRYRYN